MAVPYIFSTVPGGTSIPLSELDANFSYLSTSPSLTSLNITGNLTVGGVGTFAGLISANGGLSLTGALNLNGSIGSNNQVVYSNSGIPSWAFINPNMLTTGHPSWDATGNLTAIGDITSGTGTFKSGNAANSQILLGSNNFSIYLNSTDYFNVTSSLTTISNNLLVTGISSTFNNIVNVNGGLSLVGSFNANGSTGSSNTVLLINGATPTWGQVGPSYLTSGGPTWDGSGNVSATLGIGSGTGTFYNTASASCNLTLNTTAATLNVNGAAVITAANTGNTTLLNNLTVGGSISANNTISGSGGLNITGASSINGSLNLTGNQTLTGNLSVSGTSNLSGAVTSSGVATFSNAVTFNSTVAANGNLTITGNTNQTGNVTVVGIINASDGGTPNPNLGVIICSSVNFQNSGPSNAFLTAGGDVFQFTCSSTNPVMQITRDSTTTTSYRYFVNSIQAAFHQLSGTGFNLFSVPAATFVSTTDLTNGNLTILGTLTQGSDEKLKTNIKEIPADRAINNIRQLKGVTYNLLSDPTGPTHMGFVANDVEKIVPEATLDVDMSEKSDGSGVIKTLSYTSLIPLLLEAIKEIDARLTAKGI
jgi:hypothetical protein